MSPNRSARVSGVAQVSRKMEVHSGGSLLFISSNKSRLRSAITSSKGAIAGDAAFGKALFACANEQSLLQPSHHGLLYDLVFQCRNAQRASSGLRYTEHPHV